MLAHAIDAPATLEICAPLHPRHSTILTPEACAFVAGLCREFGPQIERMLAARKEARARFQTGEPLSYRGEARPIRGESWTVPPAPPDLCRRKVEIVGGVDRRSVLLGMNSGADVYVADFFDATAPTWDNLLGGQLNLRDAVRGSIQFQDDARGEVERLTQSPATLMVQPRGWHMYEEHVRCDGTPVPGALFDFGLYLFHNARTLLERGSGPYFYLPQLRGYREARLWNQIFAYAQTQLVLPRGKIRATVVIDTLPAAFEMDEILWELRVHSAGLKYGHWDYLSSFIQTFGQHAEYILPDRHQIDLSHPFMRAFTQLLVQTCHRRGAHAIGGTACQIPAWPGEAESAALTRMRVNRAREAADGYDGTWVTHPGLVDPIREIFDRAFAHCDQIHDARPDVEIHPAALCQVPRGEITPAGLDHNIQIGLRYLESWLRGHGCIQLADRLEFAGTTELARAQVWQWLHHRVVLSNGQRVDPALVRARTDAQLASIRAELGEVPFSRGEFERARQIFDATVFGENLEDRFTTQAYPHLIHRDAPPI